MIRNIMLLTKISTINYIQNINIIDKKTNRINKKSIYFWIFIIIMIALFFISNKAIYINMSKCILFFKRYRIIIAISYKTIRIIYGKI